MIVPSKLVSDVERIGFFDSIPYTCYECGHTWVPQCYMSSYDTLRDSMKFSIKVYCGFYLFSLLVKWLSKKSFNLDTLKKLIRDISQSSVFLSMNGTLFMTLFCICRHVFGKFYGWHSLFVGTLVGGIAINIERKSRRGMLALYLANLASETLYNMAVSRNFIQAIPNGEVLIFIVASSGFMALFRRKQGLDGNLSKPLQMFVGPHETTLPGEKKSEERKTKSKSVAIKILESLENRLKQCHMPHHSCPHPHSCLHYFSKGFSRNFSLGYVVQVALGLLRSLRGRQKWKVFLQSLTSLRTCSLGLFFGFYSALFRLSNCLLRRVNGRDRPTLYGGLSGAFAGLAAFFYKSTTISMYFLFKLFEIFSLKAVERGWLPALPNFDKFIYAISLGVLLHSAVLEPHNVRPAYWKFICGVSGGKFPFMFRKLFDVYGTDASRLYPDFVPNLDPDHVASSRVAALIKFYRK